MTYRQFLSELERGNVGSFYLFEGKENYLKKEALNKLKDKIIPRQYEDFNLHFMNANQFTGQEIVEAAYQIPFNNKLQMIVVQEVENFSQNDEETILKYLKNPLNLTCMVFIGEKVDERRKLYKFFKEKGKIVSFNYLKETELLRWIEERVKKEGKVISPEAALQLYQRSGGSIFLLENEINKLICFVHPQEKIDESHIAKICGESPEESIFSLTEAFRKKESKSALYILNKLLLQGKEPLLILSLLKREVRILLRIKLAESKITPLEACRYIFKTKNNYRPFFLKKAKEYIEAAKNFTQHDLLIAHQKMLEVEFLLKRGKKGEVLLPRLLMDIIP